MGTHDDRKAMHLAHRRWTQDDPSADTPFAAGFYAGMSHATEKIRKDLEPDCVDEETNEAYDRMNTAAMPDVNHFQTIPKPQGG